MLVHICTLLLSLEYGRVTVQTTYILYSKENK